MIKRAAVGDIEGSKAFGNLVKQGTKKTSGKAKAAPKKGAVKKAAPTAKENSSTKGKTPSAKNVREALKGGHIKPGEAANLNPRGGLNPRARDVQSAFRGGKISYEEAKDLSPNIKLRK
jgi:hypothetical protein